MFNIKLLKEEDMNRMLQSMLRNNEELRCKLCGLITITDDNIFKLQNEENISSVAGSKIKGFSKRYCYIGVTNNEILVTVLNNINISKINNLLRIPLDKISVIEVNKCVMCKNVKVKIILRCNAVINLYVVSSTLLCGVLGQKTNSSEFFKILSEL